MHCKWWHIYKILDSGDHQGYPISAFLFIFALQVSFVLIKSKNNIKGLDIYGHNFLYTACTDESSFLFKNKKSVIEAFKVLHKFSVFSELKSNKEKCEVASTVVKKWIQVALCGIKNIDLKKNTVEVLGVHYACNKKLENEKNFKNYIQKIETVLKIWRMINLTLEGKITISKIFAISKIIHLASVTVLPNSTITQPNKAYKEFIGSH